MGDLVKTYEVSRYIFTVDTGAYYAPLREVMRVISVGGGLHANTHKRVLTQKLFGSCLTGLEEHLQVKAEKKTE